MQLSLIGSDPDIWTSDDWQTPDDLSRRLGGYVTPGDRVIVDAGAGTGQISRHLPPGSHAVETSPRRVAQGLTRAPHCRWHERDFLSWGKPGTVDLIVANPPFSRIVEFINHGVALLTPQGRMVFVGPCDTFHKPTLLEALVEPLQISEDRIVGRVAYIGPDGKPQRGRQIYDSIFTLQRIH